jgi:hypothetical protein
MVSVTKHKMKAKHVLIQPPYMDLVCYHCGEKYPWGKKVLPAPVNISNAVLTEFAKTHRRCKKTAAGSWLQVEMLEQWDRWMEDHPEERKEWEKDTGRTWVKGEWKNKEGK